MRGVRKVAGQIESPGGRAHLGLLLAKSVLIKNATHFVLFEKPRFEFFGEIVNFLRE